AAIALTARPHHVSVLGHGDAIDDLVVSGARLTHPVGVLPPQPHTALHVAEQERDGAGWQVCHRLRPLSEQIQAADRWSHRRTKRKLHTPLGGSNHMRKYSVR